MIDSSDFQKIQKIKDNLEWFYLNHMSLKKVFKNQYIAIKDTKFLDSDTSLDNLVKRLGLRDYSESIVIEYVNS